MSTQHTQDHQLMTQTLLKCKINTEQKSYMHGFNTSTVSSAVQSCLACSISIPLNGTFAIS